MTRLTTVKRSITRYGTALGLIVSAGLIGSSMAQADTAGATPSFPTAYTVNYFNNANTASTDEIYIQNTTNESNTESSGSTGANICANIYAFYPDQELVGCCAVAITPNESWNNSVGQLMITIDNQGPLPTKGTIKVVATTDPGACNPAGHTLVLAPHSLQSWITHTNTLTTPAGTFMTEEPFAQTGEPTTDINLIAAECESVGPGSCCGAQ
jgi:hypothetical protein